MSTTPSEPSPSPESARALAAIDLTGGEETPVQTAGRIVGGLLTAVIGGVIALALFAAYLGGAFIPPIADWVDLFGDGLLYAAAIAAGIAITGFTLMRRGRTQRAAEAAEAAAFITAGGLDSARAEAQAAGTKDPAGPTGSETHL
jgi:hypothetical protein